VGVGVGTAILFRHWSFNRCLGNYGTGGMAMGTFNQRHNQQSDMTAKIIKFNSPKIKKSDKGFSESDMMVFDAVELLLEYAHEAGCDINPIIDSRELGEVIRSLLVFFGKMNGVDIEQLNWEQNADISNLYNDNGFLASLDKDKE